MATPGQWLHGARPRTLPAAVAPVAAGTGVAAFYDAADLVLAVLALVVALAFQVGVNYANDYSDGVRGTDEVRVGPTRLVAGGLAAPAAVKRAALVAFAVAAVAGLVLAAVVGWWLIAVGVAAILAAWGYTGGPRPYGYLGLGEVFVFVFFGLVATAGSMFVVVEQVTAVGWLAGCAAGSLACALLVVNNLRDIPTDRDVGKNTLAVRLGDARTRWFYMLLVAAAMLLFGAIAAGWRPWAALGVLGALAAVPAARAIRAGAVGAALVPVLAATARVQLLSGLLAAVGIALGG